MRHFSTSSRVLRISRKELMDKAKLLKEFRQFLGPRSITGDYHKNKYYYPPQNNKPNYIVNDGRSVVGESPKLGYSRMRNVEEPGRNPQLHPFPHNIFTKTAYIIPEHLKSQIVEDEQVNGLHPQEIAHKYGINLQRVEAILKLSAIEKNFEPKIAEDLKSYATIMKRMFPLFKGGYTADNLTEIPTPHKTLTDRFLTIEENEPFGPVDAAKILHLEPASKTLQKLTEFNLEEAQKQQQAIEDKKIDIVYGKKRKDENKLFRFTMKNVGEFGHRYGASRRDRKLDRAIGFDAAGKMIYLHPDQ
ncbi:hypothetical protein CANMA_001203 [Candida margitis]|uniref:uncharacterized protein n=1 Tax=Candida margitis TaxID=1775924 RepID=UPI002227AF1D|nr:uncharacterized protein CANMA_001203 [Candida margitis]KAI5969741.1 hypothetical protein CANMA_001203 [Candida margitis]